MSVELELRNSSLLPANIHRIVSAWLSVSRVQVQSVRLPDDIADLFIVGTSIRGFSVYRRWSWFRNRVEVRLSVCASQGDWQAAYSFMRFALRRGFKAYSEDGGAMGADALTDEAALQKASEQFMVDVRLLQHLVASSGDEGVDLPNGRFAVPVRSGDLSSEPLGADAFDSLQRVLQQRAAKYAAARSASVITLQTGATAIVWSGEPLLAPAVDYVVLSRGEFDPANCVYLPWERAIRALSDAVEKIQRTPAQYYFDAIAAEESRWNQLVAAGAPIDQLGQPAG